MKKRKNYAIILLTLIFMSILGEYANAKVDTAKAWLLGIIDMGITSCLLMGIPFLMRIIDKKNLDYKSGRIICFGNSIFVYIVGVLYGMNENGKPLIGWLIAVAYYFINMWMFVEPSNNKEKIQE